MSVNIRIAGRNPFACPIAWTVEEARNEIRSMYGLINGGITRNGIVMRSSDLITSDGEYDFVNFQEQQGI